MKVISEQQIGEILQGNSENLNLEFRDGFDLNDSWPRERLIRSILAISNTREGGYIVIGIKEVGNGFEYNGIEKAHLEIFKSNAEELKSKVESFSSSPVNYTIGLGEYRGQKFIVVSINEFSLNPIICRKNGDFVNGKKRHLEEGAIYIRTLKDKPSSIKLSNPVDIQDFLERAVDKQIINLHKRGWKHNTEKVKDDKSAFKKERADF